ncbi:DNA-processing protein DprA [Fulvivirga ligni]|uniref:DNA-processing protein DprA n=1 Tax=Fulvivirga ligni TaxID=2904246 RepID=UPI001F204536|nr:DNA-processing protein DprA [Fulvivirga ligni]UII21581.1 DNA-protecting protein DprA [Fulvivirga ligni]
MKSVLTNEYLSDFSSNELKNAPNKLYYSGDLDLLKSQRKVSVVGSRKISHKGLKRAEIITKYLTNHNFTVVSGLAQGVDTIAHTTAINNGGKTIAVIGTSLEQFYPKNNQNLQLEIMNHHLCISQFSEGHPTQPKNFILRNRTMALISDATIIIEASEQSGTRHQGWEALRLGRKLFLLCRIFH